MNSQALAMRKSEPFFESESQDGLADQQGISTYLRVLRRRWWAILSLGVVAGIVGWSVANSLPPVFRSTTTILIDVPGGILPKIDEGVPTGMFADSLQTQIGILKSRNVSVRAVQRLRVWEQPEFDPRRPAPTWQSDWRRWIGEPEPEPIKWTHELLAEAVVDGFSARIDTELIAGSRLMKVSFDAQDPQLAATAVNAAVQAYLDQDRESRFGASRAMSQWLQDRASQLHQNVLQSERKLQEFREKNNLVNVQGATQAVSTRQMEDMMPRVAQARVKMTELETTFQQIQAVRDGDYSTVPWVINYGAVPDAKTRETAARMKVAELSQNYGYEHPRMVQAQAELTAANENMKRQMRIAVSSLAREYETAKVLLRSLESELGANRRGAQQFNRTEFELGQMQREAQANRELYDLFISRSKQIDLVADIGKSAARVVDEARPAYAPIAPNKPKLIMAAVMVALMVGVAMALAIELQDNSIKGARDAETKFLLPVLTSLPKLTGKLLESIDACVIEKPNLLFSEAIRTARTGLLLSSLGEIDRVYVVTSSVPGEGKTVVSSNMAEAFSRNGRTLLVEADMRRPRIAKAFNLPSGSKGLVDVIIGVDPSECIHATGQQDLYVLPAGRISSNALELLSSRRFEDVLNGLRSQFDYVVVDTPPVEVVSDALALARLATGVILVVRAHDTAYPLVQGALTKLKRSSAHVLGIVLNQVEFDTAKKYYGEYQGYGKYGYKYGGYKPAMLPHIDV